MEEYAKTKWCPFTKREVIMGGRAIKFDRCITTECMAWQQTVISKEPGLLQGFCLRIHKTDD